MPWNRFLPGFLAVVLVSYIHVEFIDRWGGLEPAYFLIFFIFRGTNTSRALIQTLVLSLGLDLILQTAQVKGLAAMSQLFLVFVVLALKRKIVPLYEDLVLLGFFAIFFVADYLITAALSAVLGVYAPAVSVPRLLFLALVHTAIMAALLMISLRFPEGSR